MSLNYVKEEEACFVSILERVYASCGSAANKLQKRGAKELAKIMRKKTGMSEEEVIIDESASSNNHWFSYSRTFNLTSFSTQCLGDRPLNEHPIDNQENLKRLFAEFGRIPSEEILEQRVSAHGKNVMIIKHNYYVKNISIDSLA